jgi:hypothetical protein
LSFELVALRIENRMKLAQCSHAWIFHLAWLLAPLCQSTTIFSSRTPKLRAHSIGRMAGSSSSSRTQEAAAPENISSAVAF